MFTLNYGLAADAATKFEHSTTKSAPKIYSIETYIIYNTGPPKTFGCNRHIQWWYSRHKEQK